MFQLAQFIAARIRWSLALCIQEPGVVAAVFGDVPTAVHQRRGATATDRQLRPIGRSRPRSRRRRSPEDSLSARRPPDSARLGRFVRPCLYFDALSRPFPSTPYYDIRHNGTASAYKHNYLIFSRNFSHFKASCFNWFKIFRKVDIERFFFEVDATLSCVINWMLRYRWVVMRNKNLKFWR